MSATSDKGLHLAGATLQEKPPGSEACSALLERVLSSGELKRAARLQKLLAYVGRRVLEGGCEHIREQEIGSAVFGRPQAYDTNVDNIVRVYASALRKRIEAYFEGEGSLEPVIMEIPRGSYLPVFRRREATPQIVTQPPVPAIGSATAPPIDIADNRKPSFQSFRIVAGLIILGLAVSCLALYIQVRNLQQLLYPWKYEPSVASLWSEFLGTNQDTDVIMADTSVSMLQNITRQSFSFNDYLSRNYIRQIEAQNTNPEMRSVLDMIATKYLASADVFRLAQRILALDPSGKKFHLFHAREYTPTLFRRDNVILIGGRISNPWDELLENQMNFNVVYDGNGFPSIKNNKPTAGEQDTYTLTGSTGYSVAAYLPNPDRNGKVLLIEGTTSESTEAAGDFLLSESELAGFQKMLHVSNLPYFEVLLRTSQVRGTPLSSSIVAYRTYQTSELPPARQLPTQDSADGKR